MEKITIYEDFNEFYSLGCDLAEFIEEHKINLSKSVGEKLYLGIVGDTDRFLHDYTSPKTFKLVINSKVLDRDIINLGIEIIVLSVFVSFFSRQVEKLQTNIAYECGAEINCLIYDKILKSFSISTKDKNGRFRWGFVV